LSPIKQGLHQSFALFNFLNQQRNSCTITISQAFPDIRKPVFRNAIEGSTADIFSAISKHFEELPTKITKKDLVIFQENIKKKHTSPDGIGTRSGSRNPWENFIPPLRELLVPFSGHAKELREHNVWSPVHLRAKNEWDVLFDFPSPA